MLGIELNFKLIQFSYAITRSKFLLFQIIIQKQGSHAMKINLSGRLKQLMNQLSIDKKQLAQLLDLPEITIETWIHGEYVACHYRELMCHVFNLERNWFETEQNAVSKACQDKKFSLEALLNLVTALDEESQQKLYFELTYLQHGEVQ